MRGYPMKALTIHQPWAWAIVAGHKDVENRAWKPPSWLVGQQLAIHAGLAFDVEAWEYLASGVSSPLPRHLIDPRSGLFAVPDETSATRGAIVGVATLEGYKVGGPVSSQWSREPVSPWHAGPVGWLLTDAVQLAEPVPCRGNQGLWDLPGHTERDVREQIYTIAQGVA